jgi:H+/gluconate symporter-like permease
MACPGAPQFNNILATQIMHVLPTAGLIPGLIAALVGEIGIYLVLTKTVLKALAKGEVYEDGPLPPMQEEDETRRLPNFWVCLVPLVVVILGYTILHLNIAIVLTAAIIATLICMGSYISRESLFPGKKFDLYQSFIRTINAGADSYPNPILVVCTPSGLAAVVTATAAFGALVGIMSGLPIHPLLLTFVFSLIVVTLTSSPPATLVVVLPILAGIFFGGATPLPVTPGAVARVAALVTTTFETLPFNGLITLTCVIMSKTTVKESYAPIFGQTVVCTTIASIIALVLFMVFPGLA